MIISMILNAIMVGARDLWKIVKLLGGMVVIATQQVAGFIAGMLLMAVKSVMVRGLIIVAVYGVLREAISAVVRLATWAISWTGLSSAIHSALSGHEGVMWLAYNALSVDSLFTHVVSLFTTWFACWIVYIGLQHTLIMMRYGILRGFWR